MQPRRIPPCLHYWRVWPRYTSALDPRSKRLSSCLSLPLLSPAPQELVFSTHNRWEEIDIPECPRLPFATTTMSSTSLRHASGRAHGRPRLGRLKPIATSFTAYWKILILRASKAITGCIRSIAWMEGGSSRWCKVTRMPIRYLACARRPQQGPGNCCWNTVNLR
jgi:hypothetical protein